MPLLLMQSAASGQIERAGLVEFSKFTFLQEFMPCKYNLTQLTFSPPSIIAGLAAQVSAQGASAFDVSGSGGDLYLLTIGILILLLFLTLAVLWWKSRSSRANDDPSFEESHVFGNVRRSFEPDHSVDGDAEMEWLRKAKKNRTQPGANASSKDVSGRNAAVDLDTAVFQAKMVRLQYLQLPINSFNQLAPAKRYDPLPECDDPALLSAIEQANDEFEEDENVRELALRILAAFRSKNSVESLSQIALYDLSSNLRSKAVTVLAQFDHESVFETILLACADPTREVRAAAARALFKLSFDRAHAWKRIIAAGDEFRMRQAARAAIEADIVSKSFDRLIHEDVKIAYEAFALVSLLIRAGETSEIFDALAGHKNEKVKYAILHVLKIQKDERTLSELRRLGSMHTNSKDLADRYRETIKAIENAVPVAR